MACPHPRAASEYFILVISPRGRRGKVVFDGNIGGTERARRVRGVSWMHAADGKEQERGKERQTDRERESQNAPCNKGENEHVPSPHKYLEYILSRCYTAKHR